MIPYSKFIQDLETSNQDIERVCIFLQSRGASNIRTNDNSLYDIAFTINGAEMTMEVKHDYMYSRTGNVAIEFSSRNKPSGIQSSKADVWCYLLDDEIWIARTEKIKSRVHGSTFRVAKGGDDNTSQLYLVPLHAFKQIFKKFSL